MKKTLAIFVLALLLNSCVESNAKKEYKFLRELKVSFYNLENMMDYTDNPKTRDDDFTPSGSYKWTKEKYEIKLKRLAKVIDDLNSDIIGLAEIENEQVLKDLLSNLKKRKYAYVHYESYDLRGIDIAVLYDSSTVEITHKKEIKSFMANHKYAGSRNTIELEALINNKAFLLYVNHWPSRKSGKEYNRIAYANSIANSINEHSTNENVIVLGDFNDTPKDSSMQLLSQKSKLTNPFSASKYDNKGTSFYRKKGYILDQILYKVEPDLKIKETKIQDYKYLVKDSKEKIKFPIRSFDGYEFNENGYSDHLPVSITLNLK